MLQSIPTIVTCSTAKEGILVENRSKQIKKKKPRKGHKIVSSIRGLQVRSDLRYPAIASAVSQNDNTSPRWYWIIQTFTSCHWVLAMPELVPPAHLSVKQSLARRKVSSITAGSPSIHAPS